MSLPVAGPLGGFRVIDLSIAAAGPFCTMVAAEQGADVIKVERPEGDFMRNVGTTRLGLSAVFAGFNRSKRAVCIDVKQPKGLDLLLRLTATADAFVHNLRPGVAERLGVDYESVRRVRPDIVYVAITGWGSDGPSAQAPAYDSVMQAAAGFAAHQADPVTGVPQFVRNAVIDKVTGLTAVQLLTAALLHRARTGEGQQVEVSMLEAGLAFLWPDGMQNHTYLEGDDGGAKAMSPPVRRTADGYISVTALLDSEFRALCRVVGAERLIDDPRFAERGARSRNSVSLWAQIDPLLATWPTTELAARLEEAAVPCAIVQPLATLHEQPQIAAVGALAEIEHPLAGTMRVARSPGAFSATPLHDPLPAPLLGAHTDEVLAELGIGEDERDALAAERVIVR